MSESDLGVRHLCRGIVTNPLGLHCNMSTGQAPYDELEQINQFLGGLGRAVERGATFFDTSDSYDYGNTERVIGTFLRRHPELPLQLSSKVGQLRGSAEHPYAGRRIHHQLEQSLENLYAEQLHLYTLDSFDFGPDDRYLGNAIDVMRTLREVESIKAIGLRGPSVSYAASPEEWAAEAERFLYLFRLVKPDVVWTRFNAFTPAVSIDGDDLFAFTARHGVGLVLAATLVHGLLTGEASSRAVLSPRRAGLIPPLIQQFDEGLQGLRDHFGDAPGALTRLALRSSLQRGDQCVVVVDFSNEQQVEESYHGMGLPLTPEELGVVGHAYADLRTGLHEAATRSSTNELQA
ncbi:aldo/keto reductase [Streptomyces sp. BE133]|uniref:aldo/keto reductase n=1 Tax=Streptomyces sp. BE133 TaxID=3002523 RepID=UPI002E783290|nr:aldo/keto reductase [Streptomyces sp. BE133]MEE1807647.1 aldo/keto reductase [Streptomyces sp. BE133]